METPYFLFQKLFPWTGTWIPYSCLSLHIVTGINVFIDFYGRWLGWVWRIRDMLLLSLLWEFVLIMQFSQNLFLLGGGSFKRDILLCGCPPCCVFSVYFVIVTELAVLSGQWHCQQQGARMRLRNCGGVGGVCCQAVGGLHVRWHRGPVARDWVTRAR